MKLKRKERGQILTRSRSVYFCTAVGQTTVHYTGSSQFVWLLESGIAQIDSKYHFFGIEIRFMRAYLLTESGTRNFRLLCSKRDYFSHALIILLRQISLMHDHEVRLTYGMFILAPFFFVFFFFFHLFYLTLNHTKQLLFSILIRLSPPLLFC